MSRWRAAGPDRPFDTFGALKSVDRRFRTAASLSINRFSVGGQAMMFSDLIVRLELRRIHELVISASNVKRRKWDEPKDHGNNCLKLDQGELAHAVRKK